MAWTDERIDREFERIDRNFERVFDELRAMRGEMAADRRQSLQMSWMIIGILLTQIVVYALTH